MYTINHSSPIPHCANMFNVRNFSLAPLFQCELCAQPVWPPILSSRASKVTDRSHFCVLHCNDWCLECRTTLDAQAGPDPGVTAALSSYLSFISGFDHFLHSHLKTFLLALCSRYSEPCFYCGVSMDFLAQCWKKNMASSSLTTTCAGSFTIIKGSR